MSAPDCLFCRIISRQIPAETVYEDENTVVIKDINPQAPVHLLALPRKHYSGVHDVTHADSGLFTGLFEAVGKVVAQENLTEKGYRLVVNSGERAGQAVPHIHVHILGGRTLQWPPG
jgi:histidine triad (HIT) family protein